MPDHQTPESEEIKVTNKLATVCDDRRAADLFARILNAVRHQRTLDEQRKQDRGGFIEAKENK
jgi:hypothetical protein